MTVNSDAEDSHSEGIEELTGGVQTQVHTQCSQNRGGGGGRKAGITGRLSPGSPFLFDSHLVLNSSPF